MDKFVQILRAEKFLRVMYAQLIAEIPAAGEFAARSREWLTATMSEVFPALYEGLRTRPVSKWPIHPARGPWGQPGHVRGVLSVDRDPPGSSRSSLYSEQSWTRFLARLEEYPAGASVMINALDEQGFPVYRGEAYVDVTRREPDPARTEFSFTAHAEDTGWPGSSQVQDKLAEFVKGQAARTGACAGGMTDDMAPGGQTALASAQHRGIGSRVDDWREVLRGYSWVTIVAPELAERLGGAGALAASGAFYEVSTLPNGSLWLRATPTVNEFTGGKIRQVFEALAPVLLTGTTMPEFSYPYRIVEGVDAADYR